VILVCIFLPFVAMIFYIASQNTAATSFGGFLLSLMEAIPLCELSCGFLSQYMTGSMGVNVTEITLILILKAFPETVMISVFVHFFNQLFEKGWSVTRIGMGFSGKHFKPLPIFPTFLGLVCATILSNCFELFKNDMVTILAEFGVIIVTIIGIKIMLSGRFANGIFSFKKIFIFVIDGIYGVIVSVYVAAMILVSSGGSFNNMGEVITFTMGIVGVTMAATILVWFVRKADDLV
jgi:hypothetical protein